VGEAGLPEVISEAAALAAEAEIAPTGNVHATPDYQRHLARVLTRRALESAFERAQAANPESVPA
jgi:carbon-monoxide dehydrogenase medium subunit